MGTDTEPPKDPYYCHKCKNYFYHMSAGVYFIGCPDCDREVSDNEQLNKDDE